MDITLIQQSSKYNSGIVILCSSRDCRELCKLCVYVTFPRNPRRGAALFFEGKGIRKRKSFPYFSGKKNVRIDGEPA